ncbi:mandelate racemase/muconate lactonizing enzyme family protein [Phyllobacterium sp. UNC302MFCol5.2]|uniref:mandelate racemase/muconate lactonizing enzyme family protein n=1 Tax=Phyllobacterium sp. UNC302MFCol5.2 TaxID=1449065 RepID=UPI000482C022|nr:mandelate racemase/muconate lactonizing enzyme family protein [Phyllobacterium sp. UNC302MFCol5.2]
MTPDRIAAVSLTIARITPKTQWAFVELEMSSGLRGIGEATELGRERALAESFPGIANSLIGMPEAMLRQTIGQMELPSLTEAAIASALDQASWDISGKRQGTSIAAAAGSQRRTHVGVYANINRRTSDRSPAGFAASALDAIMAGHEAVKIAPFDEVTRRDATLADARTAIYGGLARVRAVRQAIGDRRLMVDCHWRFNPDTARYVVDAAAELGLHWVECPLSETEDHLKELRSLRSRANKQGVLLAGCEEMIRRKGFAPFLAAETYDVVMPDVKYAGGIEEMLAIAELAERHSVQLSLHNPSGPICHAISLQFIAMLEKPDLLEMQFDETPLFDELLLEPGLPPVASGGATLPSVSGCGVALSPTKLRSLAVSQ